MRNIVKNNKLISSLIGLGIIAVAANGFAADFTRNATVELSQALTLEGDAPVNYGQINVPTNTAATYSFSPAEQNGSLNVSSSGSGDSFHRDANMAAGVYTLKGQPGTSVQVTVEVNDSTTDDGVSFDYMYINDSVTDGPNSVTGTLDATEGDMTVYVGGQITVEVGADTGQVTQPFSITALYQ